jgi:hypothetical protein
MNLRPCPGRTRSIGSGFDQLRLAEEQEKSARPTEFDSMLEHSRVSLPSLRQNESPRQNDAIDDGAARPFRAPASIDHEPGASIAMTPEQRQKINAQNAQKSTGPRTPEGRARSRTNALKHGLTAQTLALPSEDPEVVAQHVDLWVDTYQPRAPAELVLVEEAAKAALTLRRCTVREKSLVEDHVANLAVKIHHADEDQLADLQKLLETDPAIAARHLKRFSHGVRWMIERWRLFHKLAQRQGYIGQAVLTREAVRLLGCDPNEPKTSLVSGYLLTLADASAWPEPNEGYLARHLDSKKIHPEYRIVHGDSPLPQDEARATVRVIVEGELRALEGLLPWLEKHEEARLERAKAVAVLPEDSPDARLLLRYHKSAEVAFHKAYKELTKILTQRLANELETKMKPAPAGAEAIAPAVLETP